MIDNSTFENTDTSTPVGTFKSAWLGFSTDEALRKRAASGGAVTAILKYLLNSKQIDGAIVCRSHFVDGKFEHDVFLAENEDDLKTSQSSKYFDIPISRGLNLIREFDGKVAIVGLPCQINSITKRAGKNAELAEKIVCRISLFCGHNSKVDLIENVWKKRNIKPEELESFTYRQGHWRGEMVAKFKDGREDRFPFQQFSNYQNLHILSLERCLNCFDHMGYYSDISAGDTWSGKMKHESIKHSVALARTDRGDKILKAMIDQGLFEASPMSRRDVYLSQKRSINYHYAIAARAKIAKMFGFKIKDRTEAPHRIRDLLGAAIVLANHRISKNKKLLKFFMSLPKPIVFLYLLMFKGLMNYERKRY